MGLRNTTAFAVVGFNHNDGLCKAPFAPSDMGLGIDPYKVLDGYSSGL